MNVSKVLAALSLFGFSLATVVVARDAVADPVPKPAPIAGRITVEITGLRSASGVVRCSLFAGPEGFPSDPGRAIAHAESTIAGGRAVCTFDAMKNGAYAVGFIHDENGNGKLDTSFFGVPTEGYGASRDARGSMGPPRFTDAKFAFDGGQLGLRLKTAY